MFIRKGRILQISCSKCFFIKFFIDKKMLTQKKMHDFLIFFDFQLEKKIYHLLDLMIIKSSAINSVLNVFNLKI